MAGETWLSMPFDEAVEVNPSTPLERGKVYEYVDMQLVHPSARSVAAIVKRAFTGGGSRFVDGDTLMARITPCLENGKIARFRASAASLVGHGSTEFIVIRGRSGITDNDFAYYLTRSDLVRGYAVSHMTGTSGRQRVPTESLSYLEVPVPPLPEQRAIAHILGTLDDKIEVNRRMSETLEAIARAIFKSWFVDFDPVRAKAEGHDPGLPKRIADLFPDGFEDSELGEIPEGYRVSPLDEVAEFLNGLALQKYPPSDGPTLPVIKIAQLRKGSGEGADRCNADLPPEYIVGDGDVLFSWSGSLECVVWTGGVGGLNQHLFKVTSSRYPKWFLYLWIHQHLSDFRAIASGKATTMGHIQRYHLSGAKTVVPDSETLDVADRLLWPLMDEGVTLHLESRTLTAVRDTLLPKLICGEVRISDPDGFLREVAP